MFGSSKTAEADGDDDGDDDDDDDGEVDSELARAQRKATPASPSRPDEELFLETLLNETPQLERPGVADARTMRYDLKPQTALSRQMSKHSSYLPARLPTPDVMGLGLPDDEADVVDEAADLNGNRSRRSSATSNGGKKGGHRASVSC